MRWRCDVTVKGKICGLKCVRLCDLWSVSQCFCSAWYECAMVGDVTVITMDNGELATKRENQKESVRSMVMKWWRKAMWKKNNVVRVGWNRRRWHSKKKWKPAVMCTAGNTNNWWDTHLRDTKWVARRLHCVSMWKLANDVLTVRPI